MPYLGTFLELNVPGMRKLGGVIVRNRPYLEHFCTYMFKEPESWENLIQLKISHLGTFLEPNAPGARKLGGGYRKGALSGNIYTFKNEIELYVTNHNFQKFFFVNNHIMNIKNEYINELSIPE